MTALVIASPPKAGAAISYLVLLRRWRKVLHHPKFVETPPSSKSYFIPIWMDTKRIAPSQVCVEQLLGLAGFNGDPPNFGASEVFLEGEENSLAIWHPRGLANLSANILPVK